MVYKTEPKNYKAHLLLVLPMPQNLDVYPYTHSLGYNLIFLRLRFMVIIQPQFAKRM